MFGVYIGSSSIQKKKSYGILLWYFVMVFCCYGILLLCIFAKILNKAALTCNNFIFYCGMHVVDEF